MGPVFSLGTRLFVWGSLLAILYILRPFLLGLSLQAQQQFDQLRPRHLPAALSAVTALCTIDIDRDGDLDVLVGRNLQPCALWLNDGHGTFTPGTTPWSLIRSDPVSAFATGDVNGDGITDLVVGMAGSALKLLLGASGTLSDAPAAHLPSAARYTSCLALVDVDGDGDLDLVVGGPAGDQLLDNDGTGRFTDVTFGRLPSGGPNANTVAIVPFDGDGDGDADLLMVELNGSSLLLTNTSGWFSFHPACRRSAVRTPAPPLAALFAGFPGPAIPTQFGPLRLSGLTTITFLVFPPGVTTREVLLRVPANQALLRLQVGFQGLIAHGPQFTDWRLSGLVSRTVLQ